MLKLTFKSVNNQPYFPSVRNSFLEIHEASAVKKIKKIVQLIIFLPWLIIKDCSRLLYRKKAKQVSIVGELYSAVNLTRSKMLRAFDKSKNFVSKHKSEIIKATLVGGAFLVAGRQLIGKQSNQTHLLDRFSNQAVGAVGFILGGVSFALLKKSHELLEMRTLKNEPVYKTLTDAEGLVVKKILSFKNQISKQDKVNRKLNKPTLPIFDKSYYTFIQDKPSLMKSYFKDLEYIEKAIQGVDQLLGAFELSNSTKGHLFGRREEFVRVKGILMRDYSLSLSRFPG